MSKDTEVQAKTIPTARIADPQVSVTKAIETLARAVKRHGLTGIERETLHMYLVERGFPGLNPPEDEL